MSARNVTKSGTYQQGARSSAGEGECVWLHVIQYPPLKMPQSKKTPHFSVFSSIYRYVPKGLEVFSF